MDTKRPFTRRFAAPTLIGIGLVIYVAAYPAVLMLVYFRMIDDTWWGRLMLSPFLPLMWLEDNAPFAKRLIDFVRDLYNFLLAS